MTAAPRPAATDHDHSAPNLPPLARLRTGGPPASGWSSLVDEAEFVAARGPAPVAAGLGRMTCMRAGIGRGHDAEVAAGFRIAAQAVRRPERLDAAGRTHRRRRVDTDLQGRLHVGPATPS